MRIHLRGSKSHLDGEGGGESGGVGEEHEEVTLALVNTFIHPTGNMSSAALLQPSKGFGYRTE